MVFKRFFDFLQYWYFQYTLATAVYMLEPTERKVVNSVLVGIIAIGLYSAFLFLPGHAVMMKHFFDHMFLEDNAAPPPQTT